MSDVNIYLEERFVNFKGSYYSLVYDNIFWERYLNVFDRVKVIARVNYIDKIEDLPKGYKKVKNYKVEFISLPYYKGLIQGIIVVPLLFFYIIKVVYKSENNILRLPGIISIITGLLSLIIGRKFAVELVGDPYDVFSSGVGGKLSPLLRIIFTFFTKYLIRKANAVSYVTEKVMQERYPALENTFCTHYSSICLEENVFDKKNIRKKINKNKCQILLVGSLEQMYKGFDIAVEAINILEFKSKIILHIVGDGFYKESLIKLIEEKELKKNVIFHGKVAREDIFSLMEKVDIFIMPSRTEGLPRALLEAMAKGLPAIGSNIGGIPELLNNNWIFKSEDYKDLAEKITELYYSNNIQDISESNMLKAKEFQSSILEIRRNKFYSVLKDSI